MAAGGWQARMSARPKKNRRLRIFLEEYTQLRAQSTAKREQLENTESRVSEKYAF